MTGPAPEKTLWSGNPSYWNWWPELAAGDLAVVLGAVLWWAGRTPWIAAAAGLALAFYLIPYFRRRAVLYTLTDQRVRSRTGLFSLRVDEVELRDIRNIILQQSLLQRLTGTGDIGISSAGGEGIEVSLRGIPAAAEVKELVRQARQAAGGDHAGAD